MRIFSACLLALILWALWQATEIAEVRRQVETLRHEVEAVQEDRALLWEALLEVSDTNNNF